jgi:hypothetical protein
MIRRYIKHLQRKDEVNFCLKIRFLLVLDHKLLKHMNFRHHLLLGIKFDILRNSFLFRSCA